MKPVRILMLLLFTYFVAAWLQAQRKPTFTAFDPLGSTFTIADDINAAGVITGFYFDASNVIHGFLRAPDGSFTQIDAPGAGTGPGQGTFNNSSNQTGASTGYYVDTGYVSHGYLRAR